MRRFCLLTICLAACAGSRYRGTTTELVGHGNGMVSSRASVVAADTDLVSAPGAGGIQLPQGNYEIAMRFEVPRAQVVEWKVVCPGVNLDGQVGETTDQYRTRRLAELTRDREEQAQRASAAANIVLGAASPPNVRAQVDLHADPALALPPGDIGRGTLVTSARVITAGDGVCALQVNADDPEVRASYTITRIRDLAAEQRMRTIAAREVAVKARGELTAQLVTAGADPAVHTAQVQARIDARAQLETTAIFARQEYLLYLSGKCNAKPGQKDDDERIRREARLEADAVRAQRRDQAALRARGTLSAQLVALGAKARPPMPPPKPEEPGPPPYATAEWVAGYWVWEAGDWMWHDGGWYDEEHDFDANLIGADAGAGVHNKRTYEDYPSRPYLTGVRDHRKKREHSRDHRESGSGSRSLLETGISAVKDDSSKTRDHRSDDNSSHNARREWVPRDADDKKDDDKAERVRDHRR